MNEAEDDEQEQERPRYDPRGWSRRAVIAVVLVAALSAGVGASVLSGPAAVEGVVPLGTDSGMDVLVEDHGGTVQLADAFNATGMELQTANGNVTVVAASSGESRVQLTQITGSETQLTNINAGPNDITVSPEDKASARVGGGITALDFRSKSAVSANDGNVDFSYAADSDGTVTVGGLPANTKLVPASPDGSSVGEATTTNSNGRGEFTLSATGSKTDVLIKDDPAPEIVSATPADGDGLRPSEDLSATVEDGSFGTGGDTVTVRFYMNGNQVKTVDISSNQTVTASVEPPLSETSTWYVEIEDQYGQTDSIAQRSFSTPAELEIYQESQPTKLVSGSNTTVNLRFFPASGDGEVVERQATNGTINLTGLPADDRFVVTVEANETGANGTNWVYRRVVIESLYETSRIYLLDDSQAYSRVVFELEDPTGEFPPQETLLIIEKPITKDYDGDGTNETKYQTISGDAFGASARFPARLQDDERYRLRVLSADGRNERVLGFYQVYGEAIEPLKIQRIEPSAGDKQTGVVYGGLEGDENKVLAVRFRGGENDTTVTYDVRDSAGNLVVPETTTTASSFAHTYPVNSTKSYTVNATIEYANGTAVQQQFSAGEIQGIADRLSVDGQVVSIISWVLILSTMGLIVIFNPRLAPAGGTGMASALTIIGTVAIPGPLLGIAGAISVLTLFGGNQ